MRKISECYKQKTKGKVENKDIVVYYSSFILIALDDSEILFKQNSRNPDGFIDYHDDGPRCEDVDKYPYRDSWKVFKRINNEKH